MNKFISYPLLVLFIITGFSQVYTYSTLQVVYENETTIVFSGNQTVDGVPSQYQTDTTQAVFDINATAGLIVLIVGLVAIGVIAGIRILGSGLSEHSVKLIYNATTYYGLWGIFSALSFVAFSSMWLMGLFLWLGLTIVYSLGFFETTHGGGGSE